MRRLGLHVLGALAICAGIAAALAPWRAPAPLVEPAAWAVPAPLEEEATVARRAREQTQRATQVPLPATVAAESAAATAVAAAPPPVPPATPPASRKLEQLRALEREAKDPAHLAEIRARIAALSLAKAAAREGGSATPPAAEKPAPAACAVEGLVVDAHGAAVEGALVIAFVRAERRVPGEPARTSADGRFTLAHEGLSDGRPHRVRVEHARFRPREAGTPARTSEDPPAQLTIALEDGPEVRGTVLSPSGGPAPGAVVEVVGFSPVTTVGDDGAFRLPFLPAGTHIVTARLPGFSAIARAVVDAEGFPADERPLVLALALDAAIAASGIVKLNPEVNTTPKVQLWHELRTPEGPPPLVVGTPGEDGVVRLERLPPGRYVAALRPPAIGFHAPEPVVVTLAPGERREVWMGPSGTGAIVLRSVRAQGPTNSCYSAWGALGGSACAMSASGEVRFEGLPADRYHVYCNDQHGGLGTSAVDLPAGEVRVVDLAIAPCARCSGTLVDESGAPAVGARVTGATVGGGIVREATVDAAGTFVVDWLYPGRHLIRARLDGRTAERVVEVSPSESAGPIGLVLGSPSAAVPPEGAPAVAPPGAVR